MWITVWRCFFRAPNVHGMQRLTRYDVVVVGSGFCGSVSALRLAE